MAADLRGRRSITSADAIDGPRRAAVIEKERDGGAGYARIAGPAPLVDSGVSSSDSVA